MIASHATHEAAAGCLGHAILVRVVMTCRGHTQNKETLVVTAHHHTDPSPWRCRKPKPPPLKYIQLDVGELDTDASPELRRACLAHLP